MTAPSPPPTRVFISHRWAEDEEAFSWELALRLAKYEGLDVTIDKSHLVPGDDIQEWMRDVVPKSDVLIYVLSPSANESKNCQLEIQLAKQHGKPIIPLMLRKADLPDSIAGLMFIDFRRAEHLPFSKIAELVKAIQHQQAKAIATHRAAEISSKPSAVASPVRSFVHLHGGAAVSARIVDAGNQQTRLEVMVENITTIPMSFEISATCLTGVPIFRTNNRTDSQILIRAGNATPAGAVVVPIDLDVGSIAAGIVVIEVAVKVFRVFQPSGSSVGTFRISLSFPRS
jgi:hypothetical protein